MKPKGFDPLLNNPLYHGHEAGDIDGLSTEYLKLDQTTPQTLTASPIFDNLAAGRVSFAGDSKDLTDDSSLVWDNTNKRLGVGATSPLAPIHSNEEFTAASLSGELITVADDRTFSSDTGNWSGSGWSISGGVANFSGGASVLTLSTPSFEEGSYLITYSGNSSTAGTIKVGIGSTFSPLKVHAGFFFSFTAVVRGTSGGTLSFETTVLDSSSWSGYLDNISVKKITPATGLGSIAFSSGDTSETYTQQIGGKFSASEYSLLIGNQNNLLETTGKDNISIGGSVLSTNITGYENVGIGNLALQNNVGGYSNTAIGAKALNLNNGNFNLAIGGSAMQKSHYASYCVAIGGSALSESYSPYGCVAIGPNAMKYAASAVPYKESYSVAIGRDSGWFNSVDGGYNVAIGYAVFGGGGGTNNIGIGASSSPKGSYNVLIGSGSGYLVKTSSDNVAIGRLAAGRSTGYAAGSSVYIGAYAGYRANVSSVMIGFKAGYNDTGSEKLYIANSDTSSPLIYGEFNNSILRTNGYHQIKLPSSPTSNALTILNGSGVTLGFLSNSGGALFGDKVAFTQTDANEYIDSPVDGELDIASTSSTNLLIGGVEQVQVFDGKLTPTTDNDIDLGDSTHRFKDIYLSDSSLYIRDTAIKLHSEEDGYLDLTADTGIRLNAPTIRVTGDLYVGNNASADPKIIFDGDSNDGQIKWMEDENRFDILYATSIGDGTNNTNISATGRITFTGTAGVESPYLLQTDSTTQTIADTANAQLVTFNTDVYHSGITRTSSSRFTIPTAGTYRIFVSAIADTTVSNKEIELWFAVDGTYVNGSNTIVRMPSANTETKLAVEWIQTFTANQYFEIFIWGDSTAVQLLAAGAGSTPTRPACPSIIMSCSMISKN